MNKKLLAVLAGCAVLLLVFASCSSRPASVEDETPEIAVADTVPPPPPPPPPEIEEPPPPPIELTFTTIYFDFDKSNIRADAKNGLSANARVLRDNPEATILIEGHCDERGTVEYNLALGERRAKSARDYLVDLGISAGRIRTISYGEERPADPGHTEAAWDKNRRAEFIRTDL